MDAGGCGQGARKFGVEPVIMVASLRLAHDALSRCSLFDSSDFHRFRKFALISFAILATACFSASGQTSACKASHPVLGKKLASRDVLNKGVQAFKNEKYDEAICYFQQAIELDPSLLIAKSYLGVAIAQTIVPDLDTPENLKLAQQSIDIFQEILKKDPHDVNSMKQIAGIDYSIKRLDEARIWQKRVLDEDPKDPEAAYTIGVIDWQEAHMNVLKILVPANLDDDGEGNLHVPGELMDRIKAQNGALVEEALVSLKQAVDNRPDYDDAMAYLNLVYRRKADLDWGNESAREEDMAKAIDWMNKAVATRKANEEKIHAKSDSGKP
jgi:tetratricopeptide (TPR) repeat protein